MECSLFFPVFKLPAPKSKNHLLIFCKKILVEWRRAVSWCLGLSKVAMVKIKVIEDNFGCILLTSTDLFGGGFEYI